MVLDLDDSDDKLFDRLVSDSISRQAGCDQRLADIESA